MATQERKPESITWPYLRLPKCLQFQELLLSQEDSNEGTSAGCKVKLQTFLAVKLATVKLEDNSAIVGMIISKMGFSEN